MILTDFNLSTGTLNGNLTLWATDRHAVISITQLTYHNTELIISHQDAHEILTLDQFRARIAALDGQTKFFLNSATYPLFGYRLDGNRLILG